MIGKDCRCPGCGTCGAASEVERLRARVRSVDRDGARAQVKAWQAEELARRTERDAARAEVDRLRRDLARCREAQRATAEGWRHEVAEVASIIGAPAHTAELAACVRAEVERLGRERDEARAEVERLRAALAQAQRADE